MAKRIPSLPLKIKSDSVVGYGRIIRERCNFRDPPCSHPASPILPLGLGKGSGYLSCSTRALLNADLAKWKSFGSFPYTVLHKEIDDVSLFLGPGSIEINKTLKVDWTDKNENR